MNPPWQRALLGAVGLGLFLFAWQYIGSHKLLGSTWPALDTVVAYLADPVRRDLFGRALAASFRAAGIGFAIGCIAGLLFAAIAWTVPMLRVGADHTTAVIHAIPQVALAPVFIIVGGPELAPIAISALNVFFLLYVAASSGFGASSRAHHDLFAVLGASRLQRLRRLDAPAALPSIVSGLKLAVPAALVGTLIGEWFGAPRGLGVLILNAMENFQIPLLWSAVVLTLIASLSLYALCGLLERTVEARFQ
ncbi:MAG: nitrate/sulfonate/bicarbonate transporter, inner rane subunit [Ramlibacter sp.]|jgi:ABC-type nitrate/sulfonate/bicarbonate transport system permease component|nr:nitrate/sulfonate/bicarbonate transporter, inner rane subunit [Ramlibacter sp.]